MPRCANCGHEFPYDPKRPTKRFCSRACNRHYWHNMDTDHPLPEDGAPVIREFDCRMCGVHVYVTLPRDRRTVFCSHGCERKYWRGVTRHALSNHGGTNQGMSNFMTLNALIKRETRDLA